VAVRVERHTTAIPVDEYLQLEKSSTVRHEYVGGQLYASAGASESHNLIVTNLIASLRIAARDTQCRVYPSDMLLRAADDLFYYPDVMTVCDPLDTGTQFKSQPCTLIEVLSPSTAAVDLREKLLAYRRLPSVKSYHIVYQDEPRVRTIWREDDGTWWEAEVTGHGTVQFQCPQLTLGLDEIYEDVVLTSSAD
jgi:Uma2 family endonuclease